MSVWNVCVLPKQNKVFGNEIEEKLLREWEGKNKIKSKLKKLTYYFFDEAKKKEEEDRMKDLENLSIWWVEKKKNLHWHQHQQKHQYFTNMWISLVLIR